MADVIFTLYKGFLIVKYSEVNVRAYRSREYYIGNTVSYEEESQEAVNQWIDGTGDEGDFTEPDYNMLMKELGRAGVDVSALEAPEQKVHQWSTQPVVPKYLHHVMGRVRQHIGLDEFDTSKDAEINEMSHDAVLDHVLEWEGIIGYGGAIRGWVKTIYGVSLE